jgi:hypothetical protein
VSKLVPTALALALLLSSRAIAAGSSARVPIVCSRGGAQTFEAIVTAPARATEKSVYSVRIDSVPSAPLSSTGLNFIHAMTTDYVVPPGTRYVDGSARLVPGTGSANVREGARVVHDRGTIRMELPARVRKGSGFTPPSVEYQVEVASPAGASLPVSFARYRVSANVFLLGDLDVTCDPSPRPYVLARTAVVAP